MPADTNAAHDAFVRDLGDVAPVPVTAFGDFTGNGWSDLIARQSSTGALYLYPGNGTRLGARLRIGASGWNSMSAITRFGDFNGDGREDVVARHSATGALWLYPGTGSGLTSRLKIGSSGSAGPSDSELSHSFAPPSKGYADGRTRSSSEASPLTAEVRAGLGCWAGVILG